ncbi:protein VAPYRIN-LIKE-like [Aristolochia californica]|uniref:protein VAPYRIN-LIKE-like n=1 Tax=Aristolochia californica TaxID=171875 RepID=UPI0035D9B7EC
MDRLVSVDVKELELVFKPSDRCSASFRVTNLMHTMSIAICLTTADSRYSFDPQPYSVLPPLSSYTFSLHLAPALSPPLSDSVLVRSTMLPTGRAHPDALRRIFSTPGRQIFRDALLSISIVGPHIVKSLLFSSSPSSSPPGVSETTLQSAFVLSKAISRCSDSELSNLLTDAARIGNPSFISSLIDAGADPNSRDSKGNSAISVAVGSGNVETARALLAAGSQFNPSTDRLLHTAAAANDVDLLAVLANTGNINSADSTGRTAIHEASSRGHFEALEFCVHSGGDTNVADSGGWTPLHCAAAKGQLAAVEFLLEAAPFTKYAVTRDGKTPFSLAVEAAQDHLMDVLRLGDGLQRAAGLGDANGIRSCLSKGAKVNGRDQNGWTPLHRAAFKGRLESVKLLISSGAQTEVVDDAGYTPLHCAIEVGQSEVALYLMSQGAYVNPKTLKGSIAENWACFSKNNHHLARLHPPPARGEKRVSLATKM